MNTFSKFNRDLSTPTRRGSDARVLAASLIAVAVIVACDREPESKSSPVAATTSKAASTAENSPPAPTPTASVGVAPANPALRSACEGSCKAGASLRCAEQSQCVERCLASMHMPGCDQQLLRFMACAAHEPASSWECSEGLAVLKDGACDREQASVAECASRQQN